jgi:hypothetical protein
MVAGQQKETLRKQDRIFIIPDAKALSKEAKQFLSLQTFENMQSLGNEK